MITIYKEDEIQALREGGKRLAQVLAAVRDAVCPGISTKELDTLAERLIREGGDDPAFLNYIPDGAGYPFPATLCVSVNNEIVHGIPDAKRVLKEGDIIGIDLGLKHKGLFVDAAMTVPVGVVDEKSRDLIAVTEESLTKAIEVVRPDGRVSDIGNAIGSFVGSRYGIVRELGGHGVGHHVHEEPYIPNFTQKTPGTKLRSGMVIAIEPMLNEGTRSIILDRDGYTFKTADGKRSAHFEHTVLVTEDGHEVLTA
ncbi:MAG: type I methionyl aminopeptidase [Candidatus Yonathbacteria bacterium RIFCSPHIGHO2_01_FULL_51_10]|uniref:Methionine aminopeptidase n=1 Tax=Candidatus Yonathbacteria bacterium RIFCSPHIGHO2_01_FULL_51_10 TaxID=1802723 RepID=A0A1G2S6J5_9BACT|nr:MAG: type I methionyl aminopeptidase [Candidatus Yonathbacteria bacterium RIFCSPHIGHO2_01_FULL_51_10]